MMKTVLVTGASGFIGKNLCTQLEQDKDITVLKYNRRDSNLEESLEKADFVFHLGGVNRPKDDAEYDSGNRASTEALLAMMEKIGRKTPLLYASSIQAELDNPYGKSKKAAEEAVRAWAESTDSTAFIYRLPNVFGKWCRPNYNSVVATFCHNIARNQPITISDETAELILVYIDDVVHDFIQCMQGVKSASSKGLYSVPRQFQITLGDLAERLTGFRESRTTLLASDFSDDLERFLYATYTSYLESSDFGYDLEMKTDERGWLSEFIKSDYFGQVFVSQTKPGFTRGRHWHHTKIEKFLVIDGRAEVKLRHLQSGEVSSYKVSGDVLKVLEIPAGYVHSIQNTGETDLMLLIWADEIFDPKAPDTFYTEV